MELEFKTLVKLNSNNQFKDKDYVEGRISGFMEVICDGHSKPITVVEEGIIFTTICESEKYVEFMRLTEKCYPGLCEFYYAG